MRKLRKLNPILFAQQALIMSALFNAVDLNRLVAFGGHAKIAGVVEVNRENMWLGLTLLDILSLK